MFIIDDEPSIHIIYEKIFARYGHTVVGKAYDGDEAIKIFETLKEKPQVVIMDHRMPALNGIQTTQILLKHYPDLIIIFVSADVSVRHSSVDSGAMLFIEKPFEFSDLMQSIDKLVEGKD